MKLRRYGRIPVEYTALFSSALVRGQGLILDISMSGCRARSELTTQKDDWLGVLIHIPGDETPLYITQAAIRWANGPEFGMEFVDMELNDRQRLHQLIERNGR